jgi:hypothetical protein
VWFLGVALFANLVAFFGVNYFDQVKMIWFGLLAMISAICGSIMHANKLKTLAVGSEWVRPRVAISTADIDYRPDLQTRGHSK